MDVESYLNSIGVSYKRFNHAAVFTCEQAKNEGIHNIIKGVHSKNLFIKDRKSRRFYLAILPENKLLALDSLGLELGEKLKFANENDLKEILGLSPGSVSPFGLINDNERKVIVLIDKEVWDSEFVSFHPNINTASLELDNSNFKKYLSSLKNKVRVIN
jgi:Ala-tRNA(Pro) deacylase